VQDKDVDITRYHRRHSISNY